MEEYIANIHNHTRYSDGSGTHSQLADHAIEAGVDILITTDHNVLVSGIDGVYARGTRKLLLLVGEEIHDQDRMPQKNHTLVLGAGKELAQLAHDPQELIDTANKLNGLTFLAHPNDQALALFNETAITWENWEVTGFTGIEIWNHFSQFKEVVHSLPTALKYAFYPETIATEPNPLTLQKWDELLSSGCRITAVGGSDAHELHFHKSFFHKLIFPYQFHFRCINNHLLLPEKLNGNLDHDRPLVYEALRNGSSFVGYDLPASTRGFSFTAQNEEKTVSMGETIDLHHGITLRIKTPQPADCQLIHHGKCIASWKNAARMVYTVTEPGAYRVECRREFMGKQRGWIFSNPIYVKKGN